MFHVTYEGGNAIIKFNISRLDILESHDLAQKLLLELEKSQSQITLDTSNLEFIDSAILGVFIRVHDQAKKNDKKVVFVNTSSYCKKLFASSGVKEIFNIVS